jgi:tRNA 2-thiouridine synthesizing protein B
MLHTVNKSAFSSRLLSSCLALAGKGDDILLLNDGVYGTTQGSPCGPALEALIEGGLCRILVLQDDVEKRGLAKHLLPGVELIDMAAFVALVARHPVTQSWY